MPDRCSPNDHGRAFSAAVLVLSALLSGRVNAQVLDFTPAPGAAGKLQISEANGNFGDRYQFESVAWSWEIKNPGQAPVQISQLIALDGTGRLAVEPETLPPGASGRITLVQPLAERLGGVAFRYAILTDEPGLPRYRFTLSGFAQSAYDPELLRFDFGTLDRQKGGTATATLASREVDRLELLEALDLPSFLQISWGAAPAAAGVESADEAPIEVRATMAPGAPQGPLGGKWTLRTTLPHQPLVPAQFTAQVYADVVPRENPVRLGAIRLGQVGVRTVQLSSRSGRPFAVSSAREATPVEGALSITSRSCEGGPAPSACQELELRLTPQAIGQVSGEITVQLTGDNEPFPLRYNALVIRPDAVIRQLEAPAPPAATLPHPENRP